MSTIKITDPMVTDQMAHVDIARVKMGNAFTDNGEITDGTARTIAGWWASPGNVGNVLAALSTGCEVDRHDLMEDISATGRASMASHGGSWANELNYLATWALNHD